jgi:Cu-Zn family superoxide dismutase
MLRRIFTVSALAASFALASIVSPVASADEKDGHSHGPAGAMASLPTLGIAVMMPTKNQKVRGMIKLTQKGDDLHLTGAIRNLTPGEHGFHIHEFGDLRNMADGTSTGGHFNPAGVPHGALEHGHVGDLGNVTANEEGVATIDIMMKGTQLHFVLGRAFVVHAGRDDLTSQPSGDAGGRVGVGVIGIGDAKFKRN